MPKTYEALPHWNGNLLSAVDIETTGTDVSKHEVIQIAIVPLGVDYFQAKGIKPFVTYVRPEGELDPQATAVHGIDEDVLALAPSKERVIDRLVEWANNLDLVFDRRLLMLAHNSTFENRFLVNFLGQDLYYQIFNANNRDSQFLAIGINDIAVAQGKRPPFESVSMKWLCTHFGVVNPKAHDAYYDAVACADVYRHLLMTDVLL